MNQQTLQPFRYNTRQRVQNAGRIAFAAGTTGTVTLPRIGYLSKIFLVAEFAITNSGTVTPADLAPWSLFRRIRVSLNNSAQILWDTDGYQAYLYNSVNRAGGRIDQNAGATVYSFPTTTGAQTVRLGIELPIALSDGYNFETGLINLQAPEIQCNVELTFANTNAELGTNTTINSGTVHVYTQFYEVPDPRFVIQPPVLLHKVVQDQQPISQTGDNIVNIPNGGKLIRAIQTVTLNGARSNSIDRAWLRFNTTDLVYNRDFRLYQFQQRRRYQYDLPVGVIVSDFANGWDECQETDMRDFVDTERLTTIELAATISAGATLGVGNNILTTVRETLQAAVAG